MRRLAISFAIVVSLSACRSSRPPKTPSTNNAVPRGGESVRPDPRSFNRHAARDSTTLRIDELMTRQIASPDPSERKRLDDELQKIFADYRPQLLWRPDTVAVRH